MAEVQAKISAARKQAEQLKESIASLKDDADDAVLSEIVRTSGVPPAHLTLRPHRILRGHIAKVYALHWMKDSYHVVSAAQEGRLLVWNALTAYKVVAVPLASPWVLACAPSPSGSLVVCGGLGNVCSVFRIDSTDGKQAWVRDLAQHEGYVSCVRFVDEGHLLSSSGDHTCVLWDVEADRAVTVFEGHHGDVMSLSVRESSPTTFVSGGCDSRALLWDTRQPRALKIFAGHSDDVNAVDMFPNGHAFGTASDDATCALFDLRSYKQLQRYTQRAMGPSFTSVAFSGSGRYLFAGNEDSHCVVWDTLKGERVASLEHHDRRVSCLGVSPDGRALCLGSWDSQLTVWA